MSVLKYYNEETQQWEPVSEGKTACSVDYIDNQLDRLTADFDNKIDSLTASDVGAAPLAHVHGSLVSYNDQPRQASANITSEVTGGLTKFLATTSMTESKPMADGHIIHCYWDNDGGWDGQLCIPASSGGYMQYRAKNGGTWEDWRTLLDSTNYQQYLNSPLVWSGSLSGTNSASFAVPTSGYRAVVVIGYPMSGSASMSAFIPTTVLSTSGIELQIADELNFLKFKVYLSTGGNIVVQRLGGSNSSGVLTHICAFA